MSDAKAPPPAPIVPPAIFADAVTEVAIAHGVARLTLGMMSREGPPTPVVTLCLPAAQLPVMAAGLANLVQQMQARMRDSQQRPPETAAAAAPEDHSDAAFRFNP